MLYMVTTYIYNNNNIYIYNMYIQPVRIAWKPSTSDNASNPNLDEGETSVICW